MQTRPKQRIFSARLSLQHRVRHWTPEIKAFRVRRHSVSRYRWTMDDEGLLKYLRVKVGVLVQTWKVKRRLKAAVTNCDY